MSAVVEKQESRWSVHYPKISVVTPSYNQGIFLEKTICSVLGQSYPSLEYIIVDGGSTDQSLAIIKKYQHHLAYWVSEQDGGQSAALNKGFRRCTGEIVGWLNSDDLYVGEALSFAADYFCQHRETAMVYGDAELIDGRGNFIRHVRSLPFDRTLGLMGFGSILQPTAFWRRTIFDAVGYLDEELEYAMDGEFWARIAAKHLVISQVPMLLARLRLHASSKMARVLSGQCPRAQQEREILLSRYYRNLDVSRLVPLHYAPLLRKIFRLKQIFQRAIYGYYFAGYRSRRYVKRRCLDTRPLMVR